jgi:hypothetical protein
MTGPSDTRHNKSMLHKWLGPNHGTHWNIAGSCSRHHALRLSHLQHFRAAGSGGSCAASASHIGEVKQRDTLIEDVRLGLSDFLVAEIAFLRQGLRRLVSR